MILIKFIIIIAIWKILSKYLFKTNFYINNNKTIFSLKESKISLLLSYSNILLFSIILLYLFYIVLLNEEWLNLLCIPFIGIILWINYKQIKSLKTRQKFSIDKLNKAILLDNFSFNFVEIKSIEYYEETFDNDSSENYALNLILNTNEKIHLLSFNKKTEGEKILYQISNILNIECFHFRNRGLIEPKITSYNFSMNRKN